MTTEELAAIEVEIMSDPTLQSGEVKRYMTLVAEVRRLKGYEEIILKMIHERQREALEALGEDT